MTAKEFWDKFWYEVYNEMVFLYGYDTVHTRGKVWYTTDEFKYHGRHFKKQLLQHIYSKRSFDLSELSYK